MCSQSLRSSNAINFYGQNVGLTYEERFEKRLRHEQVAREYADQLVGRTIVLTGKIKADYQEWVGGHLEVIGGGYLETFTRTLYVEKSRQVITQVYSLHGAFGFAEIRVYFNYHGRTEYYITLPISSYDSEKVMVEGID